MTTQLQDETWDVVDHKRFRVGPRLYVYTVATASIFEVNAFAARVLDLFPPRGMHVARSLFERKLERAAETPADRAGLDDALADLRSLGIVAPLAEARALNALQPAPEEPPPVGNLVLNVAESCNLGCTYCFADEGDYSTGATLMDVETAKKSLDFLFRESGAAERLHVTLFGGEPLMNFAVLREAVTYGEELAAKHGKQLDFTMTTNATLLKPDVSAFFQEHRIGLTVSIDGPRDVHDAVRSFKTGTGSYDLIERRLKEFFAVYDARPVGARVTVTHKSVEIQRILDHLLGLGFAEVGFSPVHTTNPELRLTDDDLAVFAGEFTQAGRRYLEAALAGGNYGFSNMSNLLMQLHEGMARPYPCGAGHGLVGVSDTGSVSLCHRFTGKEGFEIGHIDTGFTPRRAELLEQMHVMQKEPCRTCWVRSLCAGGCHYLTNQASGSLDAPPERFCDWIRAWIAQGLEVYCRIAEGNPGWLERRFGGGAPPPA